MSEFEKYTKKYGITSEFVFANKDGRVHSHSISCAISKQCEDANIDTKSIHAIRRTISSHLRTILPIASVANLLGHLEETNEKHYNHDILTQKIGMRNSNERNLFHGCIAKRISEPGIKKDAEPFLPGVPKVLHPAAYSQRSTS